MPLQYKVNLKNSVLLCFWQISFLLLWRLKSEVFHAGEITWRSTTHQLILFFCQSLSLICHLREKQIHQSKQKWLKKHLKSISWEALERWKKSRWKAPCSVVPECKFEVCLSADAITYVTFLNSITEEEHCDRQEQHGCFPAFIFLCRSEL